MKFIEGEPEFYVDGMKFVYVSIVRADGFQDIGAYCFRTDIVIDYRYFQATYLGIEI